MVAIAGGDDFSMAVREDGSVVSWGWGRVVAPDDLTDAVDVVASGQAALVLTRQGRAVHLGPDAYNLSQVPLAAQSRVVAVSIGLQAAAAITTAPARACLITAPQRGLRRKGLCQAGMAGHDDALLLPACSQLRRRRRLRLPQARLVRGHEVCCGAEEKERWQLLLADDAGEKP